MFVIEQKALSVLLSTVSQTLKTLISLLILARWLPLSRGLLAHPVGSRILLEREEPLQECVGLQLFWSRISQLCGSHALAGHCLG